MRPGTPFFPRASQLTTSQFFYEWSSQLVVDVFTSVDGELRAMREAATVNDMSPLSKLEIRGRDAGRFVDHLVTKDTSEMAPGSIVYTPWCTEAGELVNDGLVFRIEEDLYRISTDQSLLWLRHVAEVASVHVEIADVSASWAILALQGPRARDVLERATDADWTDLPFSRLRRGTIAGAAVDVSRQGFTGELGYELWIPAADAVAVLDAVLAAGAGVGLELAGSIAIDIARVEAGLVLVSADYSGAGPDPHSVRYVDGYRASPYAMGMGYLVDLDKPAFMGRDALLAEQQAGGPGERLVGLELHCPAVTDLFESTGRPACVRAEVHWVPFDARVDDASVGRATSVTWSLTAGRLIGFGILAEEHAEVGTVVEVQWDRDGAAGPVPATVVPLPFVEVKRAA